MKPADLILGIMQFLEILLPGALVTFALQPYALTHLFGPKSPLPRIENETQGWVVFFFAAYLLGHIIFLIASFLDGPAYDRIRRGLKPVKQDKVYQAATEIKNRALGPQRRDIINTFQWAKACLNMSHPSASSEVKRYESDSKFFRSLVVLFIVYAIVNVPAGHFAMAAICLLLAGLCFWRYFDQRWKSTQVAYIHYIAMGEAASNAMAVSAE
ncbi:MAG TPA: hypothetical protein VHW24_19420 [Bryobacteraceae bacterium]|nr:hypothetical protein [Bryobacteraceae bacterium]